MAPVAVQWAHGHFLLRMTEPLTAAPPTPPGPPPESRKVHDTPYSVGGIVLMTTAIASVLVMNGFSAMFVSNRGNLGSAVSDTTATLPYALIAALAISGLRRTSALVTLPVVGFYGFFAVVVRMLSLDPTAGLFVILQAAMLGAAIAEFWPWETMFFAQHPRARFAGPIAGGAVWLLSALFTTATYSTELTRREARVDSEGAVELRYRRLNMISWTNHDNWATLDRVVTCVEYFRGGHDKYMERALPARPYARSLRDVHTWSQSDELGHTAGCDYATEHDTVLRENARYALRYTPPPAGKSDPLRAGGFTLALDALWPHAEDSLRGIKAGAPGTVSYLIDTAGHIHYTSERRPARLSDSLLARCATGSGRQDCDRWLPRQRWGVTRALPSTDLRLSRTRAGDTATAMIDFGLAGPQDSVRSMTMDWGDGTPVQTVKLVGPSQAKLVGITHMPTHVYRKAGTFIGRATIVTVDGSRYVEQDTMETYDMLRVSGIIGTDASGRLVLGGAKAEIRQALLNLRAQLDRRGRTLDDLEHCNIWYADYYGGDPEIVEPIFTAFFAGRHQPQLINGIGGDAPQHARVELECRGFEQ